MEELIKKLIAQISILPPHKEERALTDLIERAIDARKGMVRCEIDEIDPENVWCIRCGLIVTKNADQICCDCKLS